MKVKVRPVELICIVIIALDLAIVIGNLLVRWITTGKPF